jgi:hypothetical protein
MLGAPATFALGGAGSLAAAAVFAGRIPNLREVVRPIYARLGILPEVARGIQAVTHRTTPTTLDASMTRSAAESDSRSTDPAATDAGTGRESS